MSLTAIMTAVFDHIENGGLSVPVFFNNVESATNEPPSGDHIVPYVLPSSTRTIGLNDLDQEIGLIQVSVYVEKGKGELVASRIVDEVIALFPRNLQLTGLRIDRTPSADIAFFEGAWYITPVTIEYQNVC